MKSEHEIWQEGYDAGRSDAHPMRYGDPPKYPTKNPYPEIEIRGTESSLGRGHT